MKLVGVEDQLFKQDGTRLTRVDIVILKFSMWLADKIFIREEDGSYSFALARMVKTTSTLFILSGLLSAIDRT